MFFREPEKNGLSQVDDILPQKIQGTVKMITPGNDNFIQIM
jgi:hypothetical protein